MIQNVQAIVILLLLNTAPNVQLDMYLVLMVLFVFNKFQVAYMIIRETVLLANPHSKWLGNLALFWDVVNIAILDVINADILSN